MAHKENIPPPLVKQLVAGGKLIAPVIEFGSQDLVLLEKSERAITSRVICQVLYVSLKGIFGVKES